MSKWSKFKEALDYTPVGDIKDVLNFAQDPSFSGAAALLPGDRYLTDFVAPAGKELANQLFDIPYPKEWVGDAQGIFAQSRYGSDFVTSTPVGKVLGLTNLIPDSDEDRKRINKIKDEGGSGRDIWESSQGENHALVRGFNDIVIDPTTYLSLGSGAAGKATVKLGAKAIAKTSTERVALKVAGDVVGTNVKFLGNVMQYPEVIDRVLPVAGKYIKGTDTFSKLKAMDLIQMSSVSSARKFRSDLVYTYRKYALGLIDNVSSMASREKAYQSGVGNAVQFVDPALEAVGPIRSIGPDLIDTASQDIGRRPNLVGYSGKGLQNEVEGNVVGRTRDSSGNLVTRMGKVVPNDTAGAAAERVSLGLESGPYIRDPAYASLAPTNEEAITGSIKPKGPTWIDKESAELLDTAPKNVKPSDYVRGLSDDSTWGTVVHNVYSKLTNDRARLSTLKVNDEVWKLVMNLKTDKNGKLDWSPVHKWLNANVGDKPLDIQQIKDVTPYIGEPPSDKEGLKAWRQARSKLFSDRGVEIGKNKAAQDLWKKNNDEILAILDDYRKMGLDISDQAVTAEHVANRTLAKMINDEFGVDEERSWFGVMNSIWSGITLLSPKYWTGNASSGYLNTFITYGPKGMPTPGETLNHVVGNWKKDPEYFIRKMQEIPLSEHKLRSKTLERNRIFGKGLDKKDLVAGTILKGIDTEITPEQHVVDRLKKGNPTNTVLRSMKYGQARQAEDIAEVGIFDMTRQSGSDTRRWLEKGPLKNAPLGRWAEYVIDKNKAGALAIDASHRTALFVDVKESKVISLIPEFEKKVDDYASRSGISKVKSYFPDIEEMYSPIHIEEYYKGLGFSEGMAKRISRDMAEINNIADKEATRMVHKAHFSYYRTNLDEMIQKVIPFHYYTSRATRLYAEEMARNPEFLLAYFRSMESLNNIDQEGMSARQKGFLTLFQTVNGYSLLANPDALLGVTKMMGLFDEPDRVDGRPEIARVLDAMKSFGYGFFPMIDGGLNMIGAYGDTFEPDMIGIRHRALVGSIVNSLAAEMGIGDGMSNPFYASANAKARERISGWVSSVGPEWLTQKVSANATPSGTIAEANLEIIIQNRVIAQNPDLTNEELAQIMNDPDSPEYEAAWRSAARAGVITQLFNFVSPVSIKIKDSGTDVRSAAIRTVSKYAEKDGVTPYEFNPAGNIEFAAAYKNATGMEWDPKFVDDARLKREIANATPEARPIIIQDHLYNQLGSEKARDIHFQYIDIAYNGKVPTGFPPPVVGKERELADRWLTTLPRTEQAEYLEMQELRDMFVHNNQNIQYAEFLEWRKNLSYLSRVVGSEASYSLYRQKVMEGNPSAKKFFESKINFYRSKGMDSATIIEKLNSDTRSVDAWLAINGGTMSLRNQAPGATSSSSVPYDPFSGIKETFTGNASSGGGSAAPGQTQAEPSVSRLFNR